MDALDVATLALRLGLVLVLYVFLVAVLREARAGLAHADEEPAARAESPRSAAQATLRLTVLDPGAANVAPGSAMDVPSGATVGRGARATLRLPDPTVSGEHARFSRSGRGWLVVDLGSTNGTTVNGAATSGATPLAAGDVVALGNVRLRVDAA